MKTGYTPEQGRGFVRPGETEKQQNRGFSDIKKAAPIRSRLSEQLTYCAKNEYEQGNYINRVAKRHNCRITGKQKATCHGGQCDQCGGLLVGCQPFGSIPRCCNSLRSIRLIQVANEVSPSALAASSSCALNSSGSRIWYGGDRFSNGVDMVITLNYYSYLVITIVLTITQKTTPRTVGAVTGRLTKPLTGVTIMAGTQHTPRLAHTQTAFVWRFLALSAGESQIIHVTAWTEREARSRCPSGCVAVFAARIRQEGSHE